MRHRILLAILLYVSNSHASWDVFKTNILNRLPAVEYAAMQVPESFSEVVKFLFHTDQIPVKYFGRGGEGRVYSLSTTDLGPQFALKQWYPKMIQSQPWQAEKSILGMLAFKYVLEPLGEVSKFFMVASVPFCNMREGWMIKTFYPDSLPIGKIYSAMASMALSGLLTALDTLSVSEDSLTVFLVGLISSKIQENSNNLHWSEKLGKLILIDAM